MVIFKESRHWASVKVGSYRYVCVCVCACVCTIVNVRGLLSYRSREGTALWSRTPRDSSWKTLAVLI